MRNLLLTFLLTFIGITSANDVSDRRCKCLCKADIEFEIDSKIYVNANKSVIKSANDCSCLTTVYPTFRKEYPSIDVTEWK